MELSAVVPMNESLLLTLAGLGMSFAGFSGLAVTLPTRRDEERWTPVQLRMLGLLIGDSFAVLFLALLPLALSLAGLAVDTIWAVCSGVLGAWLLLADLIAIRGELRDRSANRSVENPVAAPVRHAIYAAAFGMGVILCLSAINLIFPRGQFLFVLGLMLLLAFAAVEFLYFLMLVLRGGDEP